MLGYLLSFLKGDKKLVWMRVVLILIFLWFFVLLSGFSAPAVRAALMFSLILVGKTLFEHVEITNIVFVAAFLSLCYNPYWLADVGFQLSYVAVLGIIYLYPRFYHLFTFSSWLADKIWALCSVSIAAQIATLPLTLYYFHQFPVLFLATNIILIPISTIVMYSGVMILAFSKIAALSKALVWLTAALVKFMNAAALFFDELPFCVIGNIHLSLLNMILMYALIITLFIAIGKRSFRLLAGCLGLASVMLCISLFFDLATKGNNNMVIYHSDKSSVLSVTHGTFYTELTDTLPDGRMQNMLNENRICSDIQQSQQLHLSNTCLILAGNKKILYAKDGSYLSESFLAAAAPDYIWLPAGGVKRKQQRAALCTANNLIISGRFYKTGPSLQKAWFTQNKGAFSLSLP
jgi:competence protein ComEC